MNTKPPKVHKGEHCLKVRRSAVLVTNSLESGGFVRYMSHGGCAEEYKVIVLCGYKVIVSCFLAKKLDIKAGGVRLVFRGSVFRIFLCSRSMNTLGSRSVISAILCHFVTN